MRIVQPTTTQLKVRHSPESVWIGCMLLSIVGLSIFSTQTISPDEYLITHIYAYSCIALSLILLLTSGRTITWIFDKSDNSLFVRSSTVLGAKTEKYSLTEISRAQVESKLTDSGDKTFRIELVLVGGRKLQLPRAYTLSESLAKDGVCRISNFLELSIA